MQTGRIFKSSFHRTIVRSLAARNSNGISCSESFVQIKAQGSRYHPKEIFLKHDKHFEVHFINESNEDSS